MQYTDMEKQVLSLMERTDFKNLSKSDIISYASKLNELRPEVASQVLAQFPELAGLIKSSLSEYKDIQANDGMKEYLTTSTENFLTLCRQIVEVAMNLVPQNIDETRFGCKMVATEKKSDNWMTVRQKFYVIYFYRDTDLIEDTTIRQVLDEVKKQNYTKGIICTSASFAHSAVTLAENRSVELINREQLEQLLEKAGL